MLKPLCQIRNGLDHAPMVMRDIIGQTAHRTPPGKGVPRVLSLVLDCARRLIEIGLARTAAASGLRSGMEEIRAALGLDHPRETGEQHAADTRRVACGVWTERFVGWRGNSASADSSHRRRRFQVSRQSACASMSCRARGPNTSFTRGGPNRCRRALHYDASALCCLGCVLKQSRTSWRCRAALETIFGASPSA